MSLSISQLSQAMASGCWVSALPVIERTKVRLIRKYHDKVSPRPLAEIPPLLEMGRKLWDRQLMDALYAPNPFIKMIPKGGGPVLIPIVYGKPD